jgi:hypothetical protein
LHTIRPEKERKKKNSTFLVIFFSLTSYRSRVRSHNHAPGLTSCEINYNKEQIQKQIDHYISDFRPLKNYIIKNEANDFFPTLGHQFDWQIFTLDPLIINKLLFNNFLRNQLGSTSYN